MSLAVNKKRWLRADLPFTPPGLLCCQRGGRERERLEREREREEGIERDKG